MFIITQPVFVTIYVSVNVTRKRDEIVHLNKCWKSQYSYYIDERFWSDYIRQKVYRNLILILCFVSCIVKLDKITILQAMEWTLVWEPCNVNVHKTLSHFKYPTEIKQNPSAVFATMSSTIPCRKHNKALNYIKRSLGYSRSLWQTLVTVCQPYIIRKSYLSWSHTLYGTKTKTVNLYEKDEHLTKVIRIIALIIKNAKVYPPRL